MLVRERLYLKRRRYDPGQTLSESRDNHSTSAANPTANKYFMVQEQDRLHTVQAFHSSVTGHSKVLASVVNAGLEPGRQFAPIHLTEH